MSDMVIGKDLVVQFHYTLTDNDGEVIDKSDRGPMAYLHGHGNIVPGLENALDGHRVGDQMRVEVPPELGYGPRDDDAYQEVPKAEFPEGMPLAAGIPVQAQLPDGSMQVLFIDDVHDDSVIITTNHPLAGRTLNFEVEIVGIRAASAEELQHGHPQGPGGVQD
jgi:FKBP-type peptidyl-prolyl cis-trans isomerase SlyD